MSRSICNFVAGIHGLRQQIQSSKGLNRNDWIWAKNNTNLFGALSKGYKQRVGLAQAMIHNPDVLDFGRTYFWS